MKFLEVIKTALMNINLEGRKSHIEKDEYGRLIRITMTPIRANGLLNEQRGSTRGGVSDVNNSAGVGTITVPSQTTVYSYHFPLKYGTAFGIWLQAGNGSGTANMKIQLEQGYKAPVPEGSSDSNWVIGDGVADIYSNLNDTLAHIKTVSPVPMKLARLKITGLGSNPADATLVAKLFQQEIVV